MTALLFMKENVRSREVQWCAWEHMVTQHTQSQVTQFSPRVCLTNSALRGLLTAGPNSSLCFLHSKIALGSHCGPPTPWPLSELLSVYLHISLSTLKKKNTYFPRDSFPKNVPWASHCRSHPGSKEKQTEQPLCRYSFSITSKGQKHSSL